MKIGDIDVAVIRRDAGLHIYFQTKNWNYETSVLTDGEVRALGWSLVREADKIHTGGGNHVEI